MILRNVLNLFVLGVLAVSCTNDIAETATPELEQGERIDLSLDGAVDAFIMETGGDDLVIMMPNAEPILNEDELAITLPMPDGAYLQLIVRNAGLDDPFSSNFWYSTFNEEVLQERDTYVVAGYYQNDRLTHSTTFSPNAVRIQPHVMEIRHITEYGFQARLKDLVLSEIDKPIIEGRGSNIVVNGTFYSHKD